MPVLYYVNMLLFPKKGHELPENGGGGGGGGGGEKEQKYSWDQRRKEQVRETVVFFLKKNRCRKKVGFKTFFKKASPFLNWYDFVEREKLGKKIIVENLGFSLMET